MAMGLPVVAADWSGYRDLVVPNETGFLIPTVSHPRAIDLVNAFAPCSHMNYDEWLAAQRTIVDPQQLHARLSELVRQPSLRHRFGEAGRHRVMALFRWSDVIRRFKELWTEQVCVAQRTAATAADDVHVDYGHVIRTYASEMAGDEDLIACTVAGREALYQGRLVMLNPAPPGIETLVFDVIDRCAAGAERLKDLTGGDDITLDAVLWLLKKGLLSRI
jgi:hypothetical protein